jgi:putative hydrolase of the HAD superfamily
VAELLDRLGLVGFEWIIDSARVGVSKPDPRIFQMAVASSGLPASAITYVGDIPWLDGAGALAAGIQAVCLDPQDLFQGACLELEAHFGKAVPRVGALEDLLRVVTA